MSLKPADIRTVIESEDDFGHEMRVGAALTSVEYPPIQTDEAIVHPPLHGGSYTDQVTGKTRQFDYRCKVSRGEEKNILLAVECKNLNVDMPMVICGRSRTTEESYHVFIEIERDQRVSLKKVDGMNSIYKPDDFVGKSILRIKEKGGKLCSDGDSEIYDRWAQALASSFDLANAAVHQRGVSGSGALRFIMPLVVVPNKSLWTAAYNDRGLLSKDPIQVDHCEYYVDHKLSVAMPFVVTLTHIHFVTLEGLSAMLNEFVSRQGRIWHRIFSGAFTIRLPAT